MFVALLGTGEANMGYLGCLMAAMFLNLGARAETPEALRAASSVEFDLSAHKLGAALKVTRAAAKRERIAASDKAAPPDSWDIGKAAQAVVALAEKADSLSLTERRRLEDKLEYLDSLSAAQLDNALMLAEQRDLRSACGTIQRKRNLPRAIRDLAESVESKL